MHIREGVEAEKLYVYEGEVPDSSPPPQQRRGVLQGCLAGLGSKLSNLEVSK